MPTSADHAQPDSPRPKRVYSSLWVQVSFAILVAVIFGVYRPAWGGAMKPLGDAFIRLITMITTVMIFCTAVTGIAGMRDLRRVGRVGGKALLYFEVTLHEHIPRPGQHDRKRRGPAGGGALGV